MKSIYVSIILFVTLQATAFAQQTTKTSEKVIAVVSTASWCGTCKKHGQRVKNDVVEHYSKNPSYKILINDLSDDETRKISSDNCRKEGIEMVISTHKGTGQILFIDASSKKFIKNISIKENSETIKKAFENALASVEK